MPQLPTVEYSPVPEQGVVTTRVSADRTIITLHPSAWRIAAGLVGPAIGLVGAAALFWVFWLNSNPADRHPLGNSIFPGLFALISIATAAESLVRRVNPIQFEVDGGLLTMRWRTLTRAKMQSWTRSAIVEVLAERIRIRGQILKRAGLVIRHKEQGKVVILRAARRELDVIAARLRSALRLPETEPPAMLIPVQSRCLFRRERWGDGVTIVIPPRYQRTACAIVIGICCAAVVGVCVWLYGFSDEQTEQKVAVVVLAVTVSGIGSVIGIQSLSKLRKFTGIANSPVLIQVEETGIISPMNARWNVLELKEIRVVAEGGTGLGHLEIVTGNEPPVVLARGRRTADLEWAVAVLQKARTGNVKVEPGNFLVMSDAQGNELKEGGSGKDAVA
jgi:hypothetical protein